VSLDVEFIQFGSAEWFWNLHPNTYVLQVEPRRFAMMDRATVGYAEACRLREVRDLLFGTLGQLLAIERNKTFA
jgi:hypothetical protein